MSRFNPSLPPSLPPSHPLSPQFPPEAWTEQTQVKSAQDKNSDVIDTPSGACSPVLDQAHTIDEGNSGRDSPSDSDHSVVSPQQPDKKSFFLTDRHLSRSLDFEDSDITDHEKLIPGWSLIVYYELLSCIKKNANCFT